MASLVLRGEADARAPRHPTALQMCVGFEMALYGRDDVGEWVNVELGRHDVLPDALLELTVLAGKHDVDVANLLRAMAPETSREARARLELGVLAELLRTGRVSVGRAMQWAPRLAQDVSSEAYGDALGIEDAYDLAVAGSYGTVADAEREFSEFLARFAGEVAG